MRRDNEFKACYRSPRQVSFRSKYGACVEERIMVYANGDVQSIVHQHPYSYAKTAHDKAKAWHKTNPTWLRDFHLRSTYGLSLEDYDKMVEKQHGECAICKEPEEKLLVDHNHRTKKVRGLLCAPCNRNLPAVEKHPDFVPLAVLYLAEHGDM